MLDKWKSSWLARREQSHENVGYHNCPGGNCPGGGSSRTDVYILSLFGGNYSLSIIAAM